MINLMIHYTSSNNLKHKTLIVRVYFILLLKFPEKANMKIFRVQQVYWYLE